MMALPATGPISLRMVNIELKKAPDAPISLNDPAVRALAKKPTGAISLADLRGKSAETIYEWLIEQSANGLFNGYEDGNYGDFTPQILENPAAGTSLVRFNYSAFNNMEFVADVPANKRIEAKRYMLKITPTEVAHATLPILFVGVGVGSSTQLIYDQRPILQLPTKVLDRHNKWKAYAGSNQFARVKLKIEFIPAWNGSKMNNSGAQGRVTIDSKGEYDLVNSRGFTTRANNFLNGIGMAEDLGIVRFGRFSDSDLADFDRGTGGAMSFELWHRFNSGLITVTFVSGNRRLVVSSANGWRFQNERASLDISHSNGKGLIGAFLRGVGNGGTVNCTMTDNT